MDEHTVSLEDQDQQAPCEEEKKRTGETSSHPGAHACPLQAMCRRDFSR